jgi:NAD(P)-dependent dehydrogenase (short-subunit alcohol dehydrogenase family)
VSGRLVVVTGGGGGIGRAVAARFAALGDDVLSPGRSELDVTDEGSVAAFFGAADDVDVLVNNAGTAESAPLQETSLESWRAHVDVNATGAFLCTRAVLGRMRSRGSGAIVTVASTAGLEGARYTGAYTASKHAAVGLMRVAAAELAGSGATANAVCPGFVDTPMTDRSVARIVDRTGRSADEARAALGPLLSPGEVADAVAWLASPEAAAVNGQALVVGG